MLAEAMKQTDDKPAGVFVRLPLSDADVLTLLDAYIGDKETTNANMEKALVSIGTPVIDGFLGSIFSIADSAPLVRQSDALAKLAEKDAEIVRLRNALNDLVKSSKKVDARGASVGSQWIGFGASIGMAECVLKDSKA